MADGASAYPPYVFTGMGGAQLAAFISWIARPISDAADVFVSSFQSYLPPRYGDVLS
jgi:hypothetical protein